MMAQYSVYMHPVLGYEAVKTGFSWPGFFFTWIWAFIKKLWVVGAIFLPVAVISGTSAMAWIRADARVNVIVGLTVLLILLFGPGIAVGVFGNAWRTASMARRGFELVKSVEAGSADGALAVISNSSVSQRP